MPDFNFGQAADWFTGSDAASPGNEDYTAAPIAADAAPQAEEAAASAGQEGSQEASSDWSVPENDDDLTPYRESKQPWAEELAKTRAALRNQPAIAPEWKELESLGSPAEIRQAAESYYGLYQPLRDEQGRPVIDPATGTPQYSSRAAFEAMQQESPAQVATMFGDLATLPSTNGVPHIVEYLAQEAGVPMQEVIDFLDGKLKLPAAPEPEHDLSEFSADDQKLINAMRPGVRTNFLFATAEEQADFLIEQRRLTQLEENVQAITRAEESRRTAAVETFENQAKTSGESYVSELTSTTIKAVLDNQAEKWAYSADENQNKAITAFVKIALQGSLDPEAGDEIATAFEAMGVKFDPNFHTASANAAARAREVRRFESMRDTEVMRKHYDASAHKAAMRDLDSSVKIVKSALSGIAGQFAKALNATARQRSEATLNQARLGAAVPRTNGSPAAAKPPPADIFSGSWMKEFMSN